MIRLLRNLLSSLLIKFKKFINLFKLRFCYLLNAYLILSIIFINDVIAGGSPPPSPGACTPEMVSKISGEYKGWRKCQELKCSSNKYKLASWDEMIGKVKRGYLFEDFTLDFNMLQSDKYFVITDRSFISSLSEHLSCDPNKGASRYVKSGYVERGQNKKVKGEYCSEWVIGISKDYVNRVIQSNYDTSPIPNQDIRILYAEKTNITSLRHRSFRKNIDMIFCNGIENCNTRRLTSSDINFHFGSYMDYHSYYICRDGKIYSGSNPSCKVLDTCKVNVIEEDYDCRCIHHRNGEDDCSTCTKCTVSDASTYNYDYLDITKYEADICVKPVFLDSVKNITGIEKIYDPNLLIKQN